MYSVNADAREESSADRVERTVHAYEPRNSYPTREGGFPAERGWHFCLEAVQAAGTHEH